MTEHLSIEKIIEEDMKKSSHIEEDFHTISGNIDWFAFETRIRQIIYEFLEPSAKRIVEAK